MDPTVFGLTKGERNTLVWIRIKGHLKDMLQRKREDNDTSMDELQTAKIRGEIALLKEILDLDEDRNPEGD